LKREAITQIDEYDLDGAKEKLLEAQRLAPNDDDVKKALVTWDEVSALRIGGRWFKQSEKDAMTDQLNIRMITPASNDISTGYSEKRPTIEVRCIKGVPDIMINSRTIIDSDIYSHAKARYRFDSDPPQAIGMVASQDRRGVFFNEPLKWFDRLMAHAGGKLVVEIPVFGQVPEATTFDLTGADVAIPPVKEACASKK